MDEVCFSLHLSAEEMLRYYRGELQSIQVRADDGRRIRFPAAWLRPYLRQGGVKGRFRLRFGPGHRLIDLRPC